MKPSIIQYLEEKTGEKLRQLPVSVDPADAIRNEHNLSYLLRDNTLVALNACGIEQLERLPFAAEECAALQYLNLSGNPHLGEVTFAVALPSLRSLDLSGCGLRGLTIPSGCMRLEKVWLQKNSLEALGFTGPCPHLVLLDVSRNKLERLHLPCGFASLAYLYLFESGVTELSVEKGNEGSTPLTGLEVLHLSGNRLKNVPAELVFSENLRALYLVGNTPKNIPGILLGEEGYFAESCLEDVRTWFTEIRDRPYGTNEAVKLMLLGNGNVGKSTLACALAHGRCDHNHDTTYGVVLETLAMGGIMYIVWDFGGQEVYHGTHRLFLASPALQVIVFDREREGRARDGRKEKDRVRDEETLPHPIEYWYETTKELSEKSRFLIVQNRRGEDDIEDEHVSSYARGRAKLIPLDAKTGEDVEDLIFYLNKEAQKLPDYGMVMPRSWLDVRQFFIDNLQREDNRKLLTKDEFDSLCTEHGVMDKSRPLLFTDLHHSGYLYSHAQLKDTIIADQRWALQAIYKPYDRETDKYDLYRDLQGKIRVKELFAAFGSGYKEEEKWLFLEFMTSCRLCFQLNDKPWRQQKDLNDVYVFTEFLPGEEPTEVAGFWRDNAREPHVLRYGLPWRNYPLIQSFIAALGRKTGISDIWHDGIHIRTPEGCFRVGLEHLQEQYFLMLSIEERAMAAWLLPILDELRTDHGGRGWEISPDGGSSFIAFDRDRWQGAGSKSSERMAFVQGDGKGKSLPERLEDKQQSLDRLVVLILAANPTDDHLSMMPEHSRIDQSLKERDIRGKIECFPEFGVTSEKFIKIIEKELPDFIHIIAHGKADHPDTKKGGGLVFHTGDYQKEIIVGAESLRKSFAIIKKKKPALGLVFLNACHSHRLAEDISRNGIYAIGIEGELVGEVALDLAGTMYAEYARCEDVPGAFWRMLKYCLPRKADIEDIVHLYYNGEKVVPANIWIAEGEM